MQKSSGLQPLTLNHVTKQEDIWSSDSDSGITVGSHSPPSKTTPDSGIGSEHLLWNLPPPPPSLLADDAHFPAMEPRRAVLSPEEEERQRKQDYVRNTLLEYERQKRLSEERDSVTYTNDVINYKSDISSSGRGQQYADHARSENAHHTDIDFNKNSRFSHHTDRHSADINHSEGRFESLGSNSRRIVPNKYLPSQNITSAQERLSPLSGSQRAAAVAQESDTYTGPFPEPPRLHIEEDGENERGGFLSEDLLASPPGDDGYGTDSRSITTASLSSPLSSSLSSLTTDSSSSLNGSQRTTGGNNNLGSARAQPVQSSGRLVMAKRGMLVKRRDLPPVERVESVTLEDRLRALTTIEEEDPGSSPANLGPPAVTSILLSGTRSGVSGGTSAISGTKMGTGDARATAENSRVSSRRPAGGSAVYEDTSRDYESLYTVIKKTKHRPDQPGSAVADARHRQHRDSGGVERLSSDRSFSHGPPSSHRPTQGPIERGGRQSPLHPSERQHSAALDKPISPGTEEGFHRAVPVRVGSNGSAFYPRGVADVRTTGGGADEGCSPTLGHGGVKVNDSGEVEIDYSFYMKATPSESNDEINTYSPTLPREGSGHAGNRPPSFPGRVDSYPTDRFPDGGVVRQDGRREDHDPRHGRSGSQGDGRGFADYQDSGRPDPDGRPRVQDYQFSVQPDQLVMRVQPRDSGLRQGGVMCSMPNLSMHGPSVSRRHEDTNSYDKNRSCDASRNHDASRNTADSVSRNSTQDVSRRDPHELTRQTQDSVPVTRRNPPPGSGYPAGLRRPGQGERNSCDVGSLYRQAAGTGYTPGGFMPKGANPPLSGGLASDRMSLNLGDLPRIQEQLRATSEMLLSTAPKRHQFASSSDIYKLFQGQHGGPATGFPEGRNPPHRHSFHTFSGPNPGQNLTDAKSRLRTNMVSPPGRSEQLQPPSVSGLSSGLSQGPVRGNHNISVRDHAVYANVGHHRVGELFSGVHVSKRSSSVSSMDSDLSHLTDTLAKGQQFVTDIVLDEEGERLSTLV